MRFSRVEERKRFGCSERHAFWTAKIVLPQATTAARNHGKGVENRGSRVVCSWAEESVGLREGWRTNLNPAESLTMRRSSPWDALSRSCLAYDLGSEPNPYNFLPRAGSNFRHNISKNCWPVTPPLCLWQAMFLQVKEISLFSHQSRGRTSPPARRRTACTRRASSYRPDIADRCSLAIEKAVDCSWNTYRVYYSFIYISDNKRKK